MVSSIAQISRKRHLEIELSKTPEFEQPREELEQYKTPPGIAADMAWTSIMEERISPRLVFDLGCGTGTICYSFLLLSPSYCICLDIDLRSLIAAREFMSSRGLGHASDFVLSDVAHIAVRGDVNGSVVAMNPPWGTRKRGMDSVFLRAALDIGEYLVSIHPMPRDLGDNYIVRLLRKNRWKIKEIRPIDFPIKGSLPYHLKRIYRAKAIIIRAVRDE